jgi:UDP-N-acetyl-D-mannosaminuronate dehydrogenase
MLYRAREKGVVGLGYVGLPLAVAFAEVGLRVVGIERDSEKIAVLDTYDSFGEDVPGERLQPWLLRAGCSSQETVGCSKGPGLW